MMTWDGKRTQSSGEFGGRGFRRFALTVLALALVGQPSWVQAAVTGTISGFVKDPSGAAIPGVNVTAKMVEQQTTRTVQTNSEGYYTLVAMPPGNYEITF